jgi:hypothetical protein
MVMAMNLLQNLLSGGQQQTFQDFIQRYEQGAPWDGIADHEAVNHYQQVAPHLPQGMYEQSAEQAFAQLTPEQRAEFGQWLQQQAQQRDLGVPDPNQAGGGAGMGALLSSPIAKAVLAGVAAMTAKQVMHR